MVDCFVIKTVKLQGLLNTCTSPSSNMFEKKNDKETTIKKIKEVIFLKEELGTVSVIINFPD